MYNVARLSDKDRDVIFTRYAFEYGNNKSIIEKEIDSKLLDILKENK